MKTRVSFFFRMAATVAACAAAAAGLSLNSMPPASADVHGLLPGTNGRVVTRSTVPVRWGTAGTMPTPAGTAMRATGVLHTANTESCAWDINIKVEPVYDSSGRLEKVYSSAASKVTCPTGLSDFMFNTASVEKNGLVVKAGKTSSCTEAWCTLTW